jgi:hypothetical protein
MCWSEPGLVAVDLEEVKANKRATLRWPFCPWVSPGCNIELEFNTASINWCPHGDSNSSLGLERAPSWASRRWGQLISPTHVSDVVRGEMTLPIPGGRDCPARFIPFLKKRAGLYHWDNQSSTSTTCSSPGPCTPMVSVISMSAVRDGPVIKTADLVPRVK